MMAASQPLSWSDLPPELIGLVLKCLPSLVDRIRLRAVCRPWRYNARLQPLPPPLPLLTLPDGTFMSIPGGEVHQIPVPLPPGTCCYGSIDSRLFLMQGDDECSLMNPFSKDTLKLSNLAIVWLRDWFSLISGCDPRFYKLVSPSPLDSSINPLVAGLISDDEGYGSICICQPPLVTDWSSRRLEEPFDLVEDLEFFNGKLYASAYGDKLLIIEINDSLGSKPKISSIRCLIDPGSHFNSLPQHLPREETYLTSTYLVKCSTRLLMVKRLISTMPRLTSDKRTVGFLVFEADLSTDPGQWKKVHNFGGQALFVGRHCSKSLPAGDCNGIQENCIYFMCDHLVSAVNPLHDSGVYNMSNGMIVPLLSKTVVAAPRLGDLWRLTWIFPSDSM